jgi:hypothetical protein
MLLDKGGAEVRRLTDAESAARFQEQLDEIGAKRAPAIIVHTAETHDDASCDCLPSGDIVLKWGEKVTLTHTCHDGRIDKLTVEYIGLAEVPIEHGTVTVT